MSLLLPVKGTLHTTPECVFSIPKHETAKTPLSIFESVPMLPPNTCHCHVVHKLAVSGLAIIETYLYVISVSHPFVRVRFGFYQPHHAFTCFSPPLLIFSSQWFQKKMCWNDKVFDWTAKVMSGENKLSLTVAEWIVTTCMCPACKTNKKKAVCRCCLIHDIHEDRAQSTEGTQDVRTNTEKDLVMCRWTGGVWIKNVHHLGVVLAS